MFTFSASAAGETAVRFPKKQAEQGKSYCNSQGKGVTL